jgi:hypothetical protein
MTRWSCLPALLKPGRTEPSPRLLGSRSLVCRIRAEVKRDPPIEGRTNWIFDKKPMEEFVGLVAKRLKQGGHHEAQKSTRTGSLAWRTSFFQLNSCSSIGSSI